MLPGKAGRRRTAVIVGTILLAVGVDWVTRGPLGELQARTLSIVTIAGAFWATEALPLFATAFVVVGLQILLLAGDGGFADQLLGYRIVLPLVF